MAEEKVMRTPLNNKLEASFYSLKLSAMKKLTVDIRAAMAYFTPRLNLQRSIACVLFNSSYCPVGIFLFAHRRVFGWLSRQLFCCFDTHCARHTGLPSFP